MENEISSLITIIFLDLILNIDNMVVIMQSAAGTRNPNIVLRGGFASSLVIKICILKTISIVSAVTVPIVSFLSIRDILFLFGGIFLILGSGLQLSAAPNKKTLTSISNTVKNIFIIAVIDTIFSFDSVMTAISITENIRLIACAMIFTTTMVLIMSSVLIRLYHKYAIVNGVALILIICIGVKLILEGLHLYCYIVSFFVFLRDFVSL